MVDPFSKRTAIVSLCLKGPKPELLFDDARLVAGPQNGVMLIQRGNGLYMSRADNRRVTLRLILSTSARMTGTLSIAKGLVVAFNDGMIVYVDLRSSVAHVLRASCSAYTLTVQAGMLYGVCGPYNPRVVAFVLP